MHGWRGGKLIQISIHHTAIIISLLLRVQPQMLSATLNSYLVLKPLVPPPPV